MKSLFWVCAVALSIACSQDITDDASGSAGNGATPSGRSGSGHNNAGNSAVPGAGNSGSGVGGNGQAGASGGVPNGTAGVGVSAGAGGLPPITPEPLVDCATPGPRMIRRLTATQYRNVLMDVLDPAVPTEEVLIDPAVHGFHVDADAPQVRDLDAELLMNYAEQVAAWAVQNRMHKVSSCTNNDAQCRRQMIQEFGRRTHREPLSEERVAAYEQLFMAESTFQAGAEVVVSAMLQSPYLLYRRELGQAAAGGEYTLTQHEIASALAFFLTDSTPDDALLEAAGAGRLGTREDIEREANRLLYSPKGKPTLARFVEGWLEIDGLPNKAKDDSVPLSDSLRRSMLVETHELFFDALFGSRSVSDLLTANYTFVNRELGTFYQLSGAGSESFQRVEFGNTRRAPGILGHAAFLVQHALPENSSPVQRGVAVRERLLCQDLPPVPENLDTNLDPPASFATNRERYGMHSNSAACSGCHVLIDPVGFVFENYDAFGRYRDQERGTPIDASGSLAGMPEGTVPLDGVESLVSYLASSEAVRSCLVRYWSYYAYGRDQWQQKACNHDFIRRESGKENHSLRSVLLNILHAPHFTRRVKDQ